MYRLNHQRQVNPGASVKLTANATGGNGSYQYKFIVYNTATKQWGKVQDYSSSNTCTWIAGAKELDSSMLM